MPALLEDYLGAIAHIHATRAGTGEISYYPALVTALNQAGAKLRPRVFCVPNLRDRGAGFPDIGLFAAADATVPETWPEGRPPDRGVVEADDIPAPLAKKLGSGQVARYLANYGLVLVTNFREFVLLGKDANGKPERRERFDFACTTEAEFLALAQSRQVSRAMGTRFAEFLERVLLHQAALARPEEVAFFLASYARDALARIEAQASLPAFASLRNALGQALGLDFDLSFGDALFRSTLVQSLFYGLFSAWVEVAREGAKFDWHAAGWNLHVPFIDAVFQHLSTPQQLRPLGLEEPLGWAAAALERVDRAAFFARFEQADAVRYFYEPFLAAFDPELRKRVGVWYTPGEIVHYMVERVDRVLRTELGLTDGLADPSVWVLDPSCGTGAYLVAVLDRISRTLREKGEEALAGAELKQAAMTRIAGFEILPAPYVIAHWQIGHRLRSAGAPLLDDERAAVYLTNALTGWKMEAGEGEAAQPGAGFPTLVDERAAASRVKQLHPVLVVLGNPPYNAFAGISPAEESGLVVPYKEGLQAEWGIRKFNLDDLYVRFFRIAERRIAETTGRGVVCFISNHSWLSYASFVVMRQRLLREFDRLWLDNLNGSKFETGKLTPDGKPDPSVFSTDASREGIQVGTAVALLVKRGRDGAEKSVLYRDLWGTDKRLALLASLDAADFEAAYQVARPEPANRFSLRPERAGSAYATWPSLPELAALPPFSGVSEKRRGRLMATDRAELVSRMRRYFDPAISIETLREEGTGPVETMARFSAATAREKVLREGFSENRLRLLALYPFDVRWAYHTNVRPIWNEPRPELAALLSQKNPAIISRAFRERPHEGPMTFFSKVLPDHHLLRPNCSAFVFYQTDGGANLSDSVRVCLRELGFPDPDRDNVAACTPWYHVLATSFAPGWAGDNAEGLRQHWPRVPLPNDAALLRQSAALGARVAALLDPEAEVPGVTAGTIAPALAAIAVPARLGGGTLSETDRQMTAGWGRAGSGVVMPGRGKLVSRRYAPEEAATESEAARLGTETHDVFLNAEALWRNVPAEVWNFTIGGYQVLKKFLSYREHAVLGRALTPGEIRHVRDTARRLAALRLLAPALDASYRACAAAHVPLL